MSMMVTTPFEIHAVAVFCAYIPHVTEHAQCAVGICGSKPATDEGTSAATKRQARVAYLLTSTL